MAKSRFIIEEAFDELSDIIRQLEDPMLSLDESMKLYKKGVKLLERCKESLDKTSKELIILKGSRDSLPARDEYETEGDGDGAAGEESPAEPI